MYFSDTSKNDTNVFFRQVEKRHKCIFRPRRKTTQIYFFYIYTSTYISTCRLSQESATPTLSVLFVFQRVDKHARTHARMHTPTVVFVADYSTFISN